MMEQTSPVVERIALGMKTEPTRRPVDGHLSARALSLDPPMVALVRVWRRSGGGSVSSWRPMLGFRAW